jgi:hypothetical protein
VARRLPSRADGRDLFLVIAVLAMMLGLGLIGSGLATFDPYPTVVVKESNPPVSRIQTRTTATPLIVTDRFSSAPTCHPGYPLASPPSSVVFAPNEDDPREYLSKMAAWRSRRRLTTPTSLDPYQASLNLGDHVGDFTITATPISPERSPTQVLREHRC